MTKSDDFDKKEKELENPIQAMMKDIIPMISAYENRPKPIEVKLNLMPYQLADLAELAQKWSRNCPDMVAYVEPKDLEDK